MPDLEMTGTSEDGPLWMGAPSDRPATIVLKTEGAGTWTIPVIVMEMFVHQAQVNAVYRAVNPPEASKLIVPDVKVPQDVVGPPIR